MNERCAPSYAPWHVAGAYFESCNCEAICPCRMVDGVAGGRSTYGLCYGVLSWLITRGRAGGTDLGGLAVALVFSYDDDASDSPWRLVLYVDERGDDSQRDALEAIFLGRLGGERILKLPWVRKPSELVDVRPGAIELRHAAGDHELRVGSVVRMCASRPVETAKTVACVIPGYDRPGTELYADELTTAADPFRWELAGNCAFVSDFEYASDQA